MINFNCIHRNLTYITAFLLILFLGCNSTNKESDQESTNRNNTSNLISLDTTNIKYSVNLIRKTEFESNENVFIDGYIGEFDLDSRERVYITGTKMGVVGIYVFEPDGSFITQFGQEGRGRGEFESIGSISIQGNKVYVFGPRLQKFGIFSTDSFEFLSDQVIRKDSIPNTDELASILRVNELKVNENGKIYAKMSNLSLSRESEITKVLYHQISEKGYILPDRVLELEKFHFYFMENGTYPILMPFLRNSLVCIAQDGSFYTAWSDDFYIEKYGESGKHLKSYQLPYQNVELTTENLDISKERRKVLAQNDIPDTWQALYTIEIDDENRLWVSTIIESDSMFTWWVISEEGKVLASFKKPGKRSEISVMTKPLYKIKNGYFYELERDIPNGIDRIVKYKIEFIER